MQHSTFAAAKAAAKVLDDFLQCAERDTEEVLEKGDIPLVVAHFDKFRDEVRILSTKMAALEKHVDLLSHELIPTLFENKNVKTIAVVGVGRVTVNDLWQASMIDKGRAFQWLRDTGNGAMIIETVNNPQLRAFARKAALEGDPLPEEIFKVGTVPYVSITATTSTAEHESA